MVAHRRLRPDDAERRHRGPAGRPDRADADDAAPRVHPGCARPGTDHGRRARAACIESSALAKELGDVDAGARHRGRARAADRRSRSRPAALGAALSERFPGTRAVGAGLLARYHLPLVQVPPRGLWRRTSRTTNTTLEAWTGADADRLRARGRRPSLPARPSGRPRPRDIRTWSWLTGVREIVDRIRPELRIYRDERGRELLDVGRRRTSPTRTCRRRSASCPSTTTCSCPTTTGRASTAR